jgi:hypothetical protein
VRDNRLSTKHKFDHLDSSHGRNCVFVSDGEAENFLVIHVEHWEEPVSSKGSQCQHIWSPCSMLPITSSQQYSTSFATVLVVAYYARAICPTIACFASLRIELRGEARFHRSVLHRPVSGLVLAAYAARNRMCAASPVPRLVPGLVSAAHPALSPARSRVCAAPPAPRSVLGLTSAAYPALSPSLDLAWAAPSHPCPVPG